MSTAVPMRTRPDRTGLLAGASALLAVGSIAVTLAVTSGDDSPSEPASPDRLPAAATHAHPLQGPTGGEAAAERFHHFR